MKRFALVVVLVSGFAGATGQAEERRDLQSDSWVAIDEAGRTLPDSAGTRKPARDKAVGSF